MPSRRDLVRENKHKLLRTMVTLLRQERPAYGPHAAEAADQLIAEFARRSDLRDGPPPGHEPLPGLDGKEPHEQPA